MSENGNNGNNGKPTVERWDCGQNGHVWAGSRAGPTPYICLHCPAIGAPCPEHQPPGPPAADCIRCRGSGNVELTEISAAVVAALQADRRRFKWLLEEHAYVLAVRPRDALREIDELIAIGAARGAICGRPIAKLIRDTRAKKPPAGSTQPRAKITPGDAPGGESSQFTIPGIDPKA